MVLPAQQIPPGEQIGPYQIVRRLGAGGMGEVYLARHRHLNRDAAVKVLLAEISMNQTVVARFFTEARATAQLRHPHIVEIFDCDILPDGRAYIVMEYLQGESLRSTLDRAGKLSPDYGSIIAIAGMAADALQAAHENGIVHRDLKPDNTYLTWPPGQREGLLVKVLDFGIAKLLSGDRTGSGGTPTRTGSLIGTPLYMSPEQCRGISTIDHRADIYSLGCMLYEMVAGQPPFVCEAPGDLLMAHIIQQAPPLSTLVPDVPPPIETLAAQMLAKDPAARPQSMAEIVTAAEALLGVRKAEFARSLQPPAGFPDVAAQQPTQILPSVESGAQGLTPARAPSGRVLPTPMGAGQYTPIGAGPVPTPGGGQAPTQTDDAAMSPPSPSQARQKSNPEGRQRAVTAEPGGNTELGLRPAGLRRFVPAIAILAVVVIGGSAAYLLTRPRPQDAGERAGEIDKNADPPAPAEIELEILSSPEGAAIHVAGESVARASTPAKLMVPRSSESIEIVLKAVGYVEKRLSVEPSRDRTMTINLEREVIQAREPEKLPDDKPPTVKKKKGGGKGSSSGGGFKAVGD